VRASGIDGAYSQSGGLTSWECRWNPRLDRQGFFTTCETRPARFGSTLNCSSIILRLVLARWQSRHTNTLTHSHPSTGEHSPVMRANKCTNNASSKCSTCQCIGTCGGHFSHYSHKICRWIVRRCSESNIWCSWCIGIYPLSTGAGHMLSPPPPPLLSTSAPIPRLAIQ